jgi:hypothetical protein
VPHAADRDRGHCRYQAKPISVKGFLQTVREMLPSR